MDKIEEGAQFAKELQEWLNAKTANMSDQDAMDFTDGFFDVWDNLTFG